MKTKVRVEQQVEAFVKALAPEFRKRLRLAIKGLARGRRDVRALEGKLAGYCRQSVGGHRVIFRERMERGTRVIDCVFAERRALVYEIFVRLLAESVME
jgi:mRNA-degrading endonuclease RelE of RelBE toxin-antitoxin system